jgi:hypothetical protein
MLKGRRQKVGDGKLKKAEVKSQKSETANVKGRSKNAENWELVISFQMTAKPIDMKRRQAENK